MHKKEYLAPTIRTVFLQTESSILAGSDITFQLNNEEEQDAWSSEQDFDSDDFDEE